jgi:LacI family transcriptional regulator, fructose operon transcriptional repressor
MSRSIRHVKECTSMPKRQGKRSTIYDIAARAKTSASTVSLVLNGSWQRYRINPETAKRVLAASDLLGYNINLRARGLRLNQSRLAGMVIPHYRNRFFAGLAETFEDEVRRRGLCPVVVSTQRDPVTERTVIETLIAQQVELLIITGVDNPDELDAICVNAGIPCVNLDLPGRGAPSVVSDNRGGSYKLTALLVDAVRERSGDPSTIRFVGGRSNEYATDERAAGFAQALKDAGIDVQDEWVIRCGYKPSAARTVMHDLAREQAGFPSGLFINSVTSLEGFAEFMRSNWDACRDTILCCFDWDPFAASLPLPTIMMRQNVEGLIEQSFAILDGMVSGTPDPIVVQPTLEIVGMKSNIAA